jgi:hypothetical protein
MRKSCAGRVRSASIAALFQMVSDGSWISPQPCRSGRRHGGGRHRIPSSPTSASGASALSRPLPRCWGFIGEAFLAFLQVLRGRASFRSFVLYFDGSLKGGQHRRARRFSGVRVGLVIDIKVQYLAKTNEFRTPVYIQIEASRIGQADIKGSREERKHYLQSLIDRGLRARLEVQSVVTGQLIVQLGF